MEPACARPAVGRPWDFASPRASRRHRRGTAVAPPHRVLRIAPRLSVVPGNPNIGNRLTLSDRIRTGAPAPGGWFDPDDSPSCA